MDFGQKMTVHLQLRAYERYRRPQPNEFAIGQKLTVLHLTNPFQYDTLYTVREFLDINLQSRICP